MEKQRYYYPFTAIVGQEKMKIALILNAVNPRLGGVLIRGEKGTAKSTAVRSLASLLPEIEVVDNCLFGCNPLKKHQMCPECTERAEQNEQFRTRKQKTRLIELPVGSTEDRVVGTLDLEHAIKKGEKKFEPGILALAHRGMLYVDEINLLDDHIVDVLLDSAAMGINTIERESISYSHPAEFILIGTMNPEEGELRPQLLDRFGLCIYIEGIFDLDQRMEIIKRQMKYEKNPSLFYASWQDKEKELQDTIIRARKILEEVIISDEMLYLITRIATDMKVDGHRADIVMMKTSQTIAALNGRRKVLQSDVRESAEMALQHRMRRRPFQEHGTDKEKIVGVINHYHKD